MNGGGKASGNRPWRHSRFLLTVLYLDARGACARQKGEKRVKRAERGRGDAGRRSRAWRCGAHRRAARLGDAGGCDLRQDIVLEPAGRPCASRRRARQPIRTATGRAGPFESKCRPRRSRPREPCAKTVTPSPVFVPATHHSARRP
ncbi:hypothetical protein DAEQUDRAFT_387711 [Daedalea quercina L-15889]|uniref:Uncharacterized protein n=1 Tax=Daedalea quercina L-15889 TaxID=1314783 RepID=A0A165NY27_9APHY|nr:hypothetical protein DAEQUDRAFT_387711 [Daedalea quercina L-15889]